MSTNIKYQVQLGGQILSEAATQPLAEQFVSTLTAEQQQKVEIVPIVEGGQQVLFEG